MDDKIQNKINDLFILYQKQLPEKINHIKQSWNEIQNSWNNEKLQTLHRDIHSLCGSAGTYGYAELSATARKAEIYLKERLLADHLKANEIKSINHLIGAIESCHHASFNQAPVKQKRPKTSIRNNIVYLLEMDETIVEELTINLKDMGYLPYSLQDFHTLEAGINEKVPVAIIINTTFLTKENVEKLNQKRNDEFSIQIFCLLPTTDLSPRLVAVRAQCDAYFQLPIDMNYFKQVFHTKCGVSNEPYKILIIDDSASIAEYYSLILNQAGLNARSITEPLNLLETMHTFQPHLLLMDVYMPECSGLELAAILRLEPSYTKIPIIFLSTEEDKNTQLHAISLGGDDFLSKPVSPQHLVSAVRSRAKRASVLNYYMNTDSLTGLLNHSSVLNQLEIETARAQQKKIPLSVIMIDIDHFKIINDTFGHPLGDEVLKHIANLFLIYLRNQDIIGRYGGEEFIIILPGTHQQNAKRICDDLRQQFSSYKFHNSKEAFSATFSAGITFLNGSTTAENLIIEADLALYQAKALGRDQVVIFEK